MTQISVTPSPRYTFQRNSLYYFRYTLPPDISKVVGKQGLRYSLKTGYIKQAERKARRLAGTVEEFISDVREERLIIVKLSETQIQSLLDQHLRQSLNEDEERHLSVGPIDSDDLDDELEAISYIKSDFKEALALNDYEGISSHVDDLLKELKVKPDKKSKNYKKLCRELLKVNIRILDITEKRAVGDYSDQFSTSTFSNSSKAEQKDQPKLSKAIPKFVSEFMKADRWTEKTKSENGGVMKSIFNFLMVGLAFTALQVSTVGAQVDTGATGAPMVPALDADENPITMPAVASPSIVERVKRYIGIWNDHGSREVLKRFFGGGIGERVKSFFGMGKVVAPEPTDGTPSAGQ